MKKTITTFLIALMCAITINAQEYIIEPANNSTVEAITDIYITWENATTIEVDPMLMVGGIKAYMVDGETKTFATDVFCGPAFGNYIMLTMMSPTTDAGNYLIEIPDNMITVDGTAVEAFSLNYTIAGIPTSTATFDIKQDNGSPTTIFITVSPCEKLELTNNPEVEAPFIIKNAGFNSSIAAHYEIEITGSNTATLTTSESLAPAHYTLHIPKGTFLIDGKISPLAMSEFDNSAVHQTTNDNSVVNVYDLRGTQVINNGNITDLERLQPGIYIVNGEKKLVRNNK